MQQYGVDESDYLLIVDKYGKLFFAGNIVDCDMTNEIKNCLAKRKSKCNPNFIARQKFGRRNKTLPYQKFEEIESFFEQKFLRSINQFKSHYGIKAYNKYWLDFYIKITKTAYNTNSYDAAVYYSIEFYLKGIREIIDILKTEYPEIESSIVPGDGLNFL